jgi:hypothetical protein
VSFQQDGHTFHLIDSTQLSQTQMTIRLTFMRSLLSIICFLVLTSFCLAQDEVKLLFLGNSLTYTNDLPGLCISELGKKGLIAKAQTIAYPNYGLEDHWNDEKAEEMIVQGIFDYVIIQQGPSSQEYGRTSLLDYGGKLKQACDKGGAKLVFFMVWPSRQYYHTFDGVIENYRNAATANGALCAEVGVSWREQVAAKEDAGLYGLDGFHPSKKGSELAAAIIAQTILDAQQ